MSNNLLVDKFLIDCEIGATSEVLDALNKGLDINCRDQYENSALHIATFENHIDIVNLLIAKGININCINRMGLTALHWAAWCGCFEVAKILINAGADTNIKTNNGETALKLAVENNHNNISNLLI